MRWLRPKIWQRTKCTFEKCTLALFDRILKVQILLSRNLLSLRRLLFEEECKEAERDRDIERERTNQDGQVEIGPSLI